MLNYLDGYDRNEVTLNAENNVIKSGTVAMTDNYTVGSAADGADFIGVCTHTQCGSASVLIKGFVEVPFTGEAPAAGYCKLSANGKGGVKKNANGRDFLVVGVDTADQTCAIIL